MFYMKKPLYTLLLLFFSSQLWSQDLNEGLIFHFPFADSIAEVESNTSLDIVGPQDLTENRYGTSNCAWDLSLNSNTIAFQLNDPEFESPMEEFTVALWMQLDGADSADIADYQKLVAMDDIHMALFDLNTPLIGCDNNCGIWDIEWNQNYFTDYNNTDTWHQLVWSFDAGEVKLYRDGELKAVDTLTDRPTITSNSITIGENFYGKMDDIRIYNRSLSESDVFDLYELEENCGGSANCEIGSPELSNFECLGDSVYFVTLEFDYVNTSDSFDLETRTDNVGRYAYADLPLRLTLPFSGLADELLSITDVEMPDCAFAFEFEVDCGTTSISQFNKRDVLVYPNPFQDRIKVRVSSQEKLNYELLTSFGRKVKEGVIRSEEFVVTRQLQSGYFLLHIWGEGMDEWIPLIKTE